MTLYLRPLVIAGCYTACVFGVAEAIAHTWNPFEPAASAVIPPVATAASLAPASGGDAAHLGEAR